MKRFARTSLNTLPGAARLIILLALLLSQACSAPGLTLRKDKVTIGIPALEQNALIYIADHQGFFEKNGIEVVIEEFDSGVVALGAMIQDEVDIAVSSEFPFLRVAMQEEPVVLIGSTDRFENDYIIARKDRGIATIEDLRGKKIGVAQQTINEFYLGRFLSLHGIDITEVILVDLKPGQFVSSIKNGEVDAIIAWQPYIYQAHQQIDNLVEWPAQNNQAVYSILACKLDWLAVQKDVSERFLRSLVEAEAFLVQNPEKAKSIVQNRLGYYRSYIDEIWPKHQFSLTLNYSLIVAMTDEARWLMENELTSATQLPDFVTIINAQALKAVKPEAVDILE